MNIQILQLIEGARMEDFAMCTDADCFDFVLKLIKPQGDLNYMMRQSV